MMNTPNQMSTVAVQVRLPVKSRHLGVGVTSAHSLPS